MHVIVAVYKKSKNQITYVLHTNIFMSSINLSAYVCVCVKESC